MDIVQPELVWIEGRCYRFCDKYAWSQGKDLTPYEEEPYEPDFSSIDEEICDESIEIVRYQGNQWKHSFHVNSNFFGFIIGAKGSTLKRMEIENRVKIKVPKLGHNQNGDVVISGVSKRDIIAARHRIDLLIETSRSKLRFTHFVSIPLTTEEVKNNFNKFKESVLKTSGKGARGIQEEIFQETEKLHFTLVVLVLLDEQDRKKAIEILEKCKKHIIMPIIEQNGPISVELRGVDIMNDDPSEAKILYIKAHDESGCLQKISDEIADYFINEGLSRRQYDRVKLHVTAMNTAFLDKEIQKYKTKQETFDASQILKDHESTYFGKIDLKTFHLSQRHTKSKDGYYLATYKIEF